MQLCEQQLSQLPDDFIDRTVNEALDILIANRVVDSTFYWECSRKQEELTRWIEDE